MAPSSSFGARASGRPPPSLLKQATQNSTTAAARVDNKSNQPSAQGTGNLVYGKMPSKFVANTGLIGIALVIRSREGPRFVFHYPALPNMKAPKRDLRYGTELDDEVEMEEDDEGDEEDSDPEDGAFHLQFGKLSMSDKSTTSKKHQFPDNFEDLHLKSSTGEHIVPWEHLSEFMTTDLESILTPSRAFHKKKFELSLDPLHFVTYPIHIREDGLWKKKKSKKSRKAGKESVGSDEGKSGESHTQGGAKGKSKAPDSDDGDDHGGMTMFNVVFILNSHLEEEDMRIQEIYEPVIKQFNKALNHAQASSNYVWKESEMILSMKEKGREEYTPMSFLWSEILMKSTLATAIADIFTAISTNRIATVQLATTPPMDLSLQIPVPPFLTSLPTPTETSMPGLLVTTADPMIDEEGNLDPDHLNKNFALLLLDDEDNIIHGIQNESKELAQPLIECIRICKPTLSFQQVAQLNSIELSDLLQLAQHLIYWRRAIAIPPLHPRETYIVSPNCDCRQLPQASVEWKKAFPITLPLSRSLAALSAAPRPYKTFFPSKNHRETYLDMLGWLIRNGWVTQLRTFVWIWVWPEIIYEVEYQLKKEALEKKHIEATTTGDTPSGSSNSAEESGSGSGSDKERDPNAPLTTEQAAEHARLERLSMKAAAEAAADAAEFAKLPVPVATDVPSINYAPHLRPIYEYELIADPHKVSHKESLYIAAIGKRIKDPKARDYWFKWTKYFNGKVALENIALMEGMKRKEAWGIIMNFSEFIMAVRHY